VDGLPEQSLFILKLKFLETMSKFNVIIVGAGIAGLSMAIALERKGHEVTVLERHPACQALGGPVGLAACATRVLTEYGISDIMSKRAMSELQGMNFRPILTSSNSAQTTKAYGFP
jgi:2-polyprenyl-6-methoxyphenol hydroxylase-like FAD-dependent oxidoreductase